MKLNQQVVESLVIDVPNSSENNKPRASSYGGFWYRAFVPGLGWASVHSKTTPRQGRLCVATRAVLSEDEQVLDAAGDQPSRTVINRRVTVLGELKDLE